MPSFTSANITVNGQAAIASAIAGVNLVITRVSVGNGVAGNPTNLTALVSQKMTLTAPQVSANVVAADEVMVLSTLDTANAPTSSFNLTEVGVFATSGGGPEQLIAYYQCATPGDVITKDTGLSRLQIFFSLPIQVGVSSNVTITVVAGNPLYIPPVEAGTGIIVTAPTDGSGNVIKWIVSTATLTQSTTLFVAPGNNNVAPNFSNVQNAINYLNGFNIASGTVITINISGDVYQGADAVWTCNHINGNQIVISGLSVPDVTFTGATVASGSAGAWNVTYTGLSSTANLVAGGWVVVWFAAESQANWSGTLLMGMFNIVSVAGSSVTLRIPYTGASWPTPLTANGTMTPLKTIFWVNANTTGINLGTTGVGTLQNVGIVSKGMSNNIYANGIQVAGSKPSSVTRVGVNGWRNNLGLGGFQVANAAGYFLYCGSSNNGTGMGCQSSGSTTVGYCGFSHNALRGIWCETGTLSCYPGQPVQVGGNGEVGLLLNGQSKLIMVGISGPTGTMIDSSLFLTYNGSYGAFLQVGSITRSSSANDIMYIKNNVTYDLAVANISIAAAPISGTRLFNQAVNVLTAAGLISG